MLKGGVLGRVSLPVLALLALLRGRSGSGPLNVLPRFLPSESAHTHSRTHVSQPAKKNCQTCLWGCPGLTNMCAAINLHMWLMHHSHAQAIVWKPGSCGRARV